MHLLHKTIALEIIAENVNNISSLSKSKEATLNYFL